MLVVCLRVTSCQHKLTSKCVQNCKDWPILLAEVHLHDLTVMYLNVCVCHRACTL